MKTDVQVYDGDGRSPSLVLRCLHFTIEMHTTSTTSPNTIASVNIFAINPAQRDEILKFISERFGERIDELIIHSSAERAVGLAADHIFSQCSIEIANRGLEGAIQVAITYRS